MRGFPEIKINKRKIFYLLILGFTFAVFLILAYINIALKRQNSDLEIYPKPLIYNSQKYPQIKNHQEVFISAKGAVVLDRDSYVVLYEKNPKLRFSPASTTKIMTALVALEYFKLDDILTIYQSNVEGSNITFEQGEQFTFENLLYALMLPSSNDAASAIAQNYPGEEAAFVAKMNEKAKELHLTDTFFGEPIGLLDEKVYTTPLDLARLAAQALENSTLAKVVSTRNREIVSLQGKNYSLYNINRLLDLPGVSGVKTGFTEGAGEVLVTSKKISGEGAEIVIVVMQSEDRFLDTQILLEFLNNNINYLSIQP
ncbi:MAG: D-alanyl-D-alanine carboxypeptidase [Candidatus Levybacteria bacterium]|nr:D-alanyl-D-alanine carboxypeptidase [Candidatus Levybacteria bacterium]